MTYNEDIEESIANCVELEKIIEELIQEYTDTPGQKKKLQLEIDSKIKSVKTDLDFIDVEISEMQDGPMKDEYVEKYKEHIETVRQLENTFAMAVKPPEEEKNNNVAVQDLMGKAVNLQEEQKNSLTNTIQMAQASQDLGTNSLEEIKRQQDQMNKMDQDLDAMDSELDRAKVVMKQMVNRAAGDNCVRVLIILVCLCIIGVIVTEIVAPGTIKNQVEKGFTTEGSGTNQSEII